MECSTAGFLQIFQKHLKIWIWGGGLGIRHGVQACWVLIMECKHFNDFFEIP